MPCPLPLLVLSATVVVVDVYNLVVVVGVAVYDVAVCVDLR